MNHKLWFSYSLQKSKDHSVYWVLCVFPVIPGEEVVEMGGKIRGRSAILGVHKKSALPGDKNRVDKWI